MTRETSLTKKHIELGAKMVPFAGFNMPVYYSGIIDEHTAVREQAGIFDVSHMGEVSVKGPNSLSFLQYITSNNVSKLTPGKIQYSCFPNDKGGIVDDLLVYMMNEDDYLLVINAANIDKDWAWIQKHNERFSADIKNISDDISQIAVQGPKATEILQKLTDIDLSEIKYYTFRIGTFAGKPDIIISATGYTGSGGFEIYSENSVMPEIWDEIMKLSDGQNLKPTGLGCRDTLRLEMGYCLYGNDINDTTSPIEAGLGWITKFSKDFLSKEIFEKQKSEGVEKKLVGMKLLDKGIPRQHFKIMNGNNEVIGEVTSGTMSPSLKVPIAMGYVSVNHSKPETEIFIESRNKLLKAKVVKLPFFNKES